MQKTLILLVFLFFCSSIQARQHSVARRWNEVLLFAISNDLARPTVHARNLFHSSVAMYDAWAAYEDSADTYLLGKTVHGFKCPFFRVRPIGDVKAAQEKAISFAMYRLMRHRFIQSPGAAKIFQAMDNLMDSLGYDTNITGTNYLYGAAELGNYIGQQLIAYGLQDGSNEAKGYANTYYKPVNPPMPVDYPGNKQIKDLNRWQPLQFAQFIDQSGNISNNAVPAFLSPEWGNVSPFALRAEDAVTYKRSGYNYKVYHDPGPPALIGNGDLSDAYKWNFALVIAWSSLLRPFDTVKIDISPASIGNVTTYPAAPAGLRDFYNFFEGGDPGTGHALNPATGQAYTPQRVPRGDYMRVLAEFWADGPKSVTPPGHWFEILNYVGDQPSLQKRVRGAGPLCDDLEWDVKSYFALGGAMHDAAISAWSIKGWYDGVRPVSAIRGMADLGQSSDPNLPNYHPNGLPLIPGLIEIIGEGDSLQGANKEYIGKLKIKTWRGPGYIKDAKKDVAGVGWVRANYWWPYQRPTFVSPPFGGYISGHSTYSRAAAELLTALTGDPYFPGGMGTFYCKKNEYLVFEDGPAVDVTLQWATYRDASDQCSLSRIYGGIHPPMDDMPGRLIGMKIGPDALAFAEQYFTRTAPADTVNTFRMYPNPANFVTLVEYQHRGLLPARLYTADGRLARDLELDFIDDRALLDLSSLPAGVYVLVGEDRAGKRLFQQKLVRSN